MNQIQRKWWKDPKLLLSLLLVLSVMAVIFYFSAQPVKKSSGTSAGFVTRLIRWLLPGYSDLPKSQRRLIYRRFSFAVRKSAHILEFGALGFSLMLHLNEWKKRGRLSRIWLWSWGIGTLYAVTDELHQFFVEGRGPRVYDVGFDSAGTIIGVLFFLLCASLIRRYEHRGRGSGTTAT